MDEIRNILENMDRQIHLDNMIFNFFDQFVFSLEDLYDAAPLKTCLQLR